MSTPTAAQYMSEENAAQPQVVDVVRLHDKYSQIRSEVQERMSHRKTPSRIWSKAPYVLIIPFIGVITGSLSFFFYALLGILAAAVVFGVSRFFVGSVLE